LSQRDKASGVPSIPLFQKERHKGAKSLMSPVKGIRKSRARVSTVRWDLKEAGDIIIAVRTGIA